VFVCLFGPSCPCDTMSAVDSSAPAPDSSSSSSFALEGWLTKEGDVVKNWKRRWFSIQRTTLIYYDNPASVRPRGAVRLRDIRNVRAAPDRGRDNCFTFDVPGRHFYACADSDDDARAWIAVLDRAAAHARIYGVPDTPAALAGVSTSLATSSASALRGQDSAAHGDLDRDDDDQALISRLDELDDHIAAGDRHVLVAVCPHGFPDGVEWKTVLTAVAKALAAVQCSEVLIGLIRLDSTHGNVELAPLLAPASAQLPVLRLVFRPLLNLDPAPFPLGSVPFTASLVLQFVLHALGASTFAAPVPRTAELGAYALASSQRSSSQSENAGALVGATSSSAAVWDTGDASDDAQTAPGRVPSSASEASSSAQRRSRSGSTSSSSSSSSSDDDDGDGKSTISNVGSVSGHTPALSVVVTATATADSDAARPPTPPLHAPMHGVEESMVSTASEALLVTPTKSGGNPARRSVSFAAEDTTISAGLADRALANTVVGRGQRSAPSLQLQGRPIEKMDFHGRGPLLSEGPCSMSWSTAMTTSTGGSSLASVRPTELRRSARSLFGVQSVTVEDSAGESEFSSIRGLYKSVVEAILDPGLTLEGDLAQVSTADMLTLVQRLFALGDAEHANIVNEARAHFSAASSSSGTAGSSAAAGGSKSGRALREVDVTVLRAAGTMAKGKRVGQEKANDAFCTVALVCRPRDESTFDVADAYETSVVRSLDPVWTERNSFSLVDKAGDATDLLVEVWNKDTSGRDLAEKLVKKQRHDFLGRVFIPLEGLSGFTDKWFESHVSGKLQLTVTVGTRVAVCIVDVHGS
jgi:hypothetical protein